MLLRLLLVAAAWCAACAEPDPAIEFNRIPNLRDEDKCYDSNGRPQVRERVHFSDGFFFFFSFCWKLVSIVSE